MKRDCFPCLVYIKSDFCSKFMWVSKFWRVFYWPDSTYLKGVLGRYQRQIFSIIDKKIRVPVQAFCWNIFLRMRTLRISQELIFGNWRIEYFAGINFCELENRKFREFAYFAELNFANSSKISHIKSREKYFPRKLIPLRYIF